MLIVTATDLPRLMACNGSRLMEGAKPSIGVENITRDEGNAAHWLIEQVHSGRHGLEELIDRKAANQIFITADMAEHVENFLKTIGPGGYVEHETSFNGANWQVNSRADHVRHDQVNNVLFVDDFKYGWGIVDVEDNWTLIAHAIGYCINHKVTPTQIFLTVHQPRPDHAEGKVRATQIGYQKLLELYAQINATLSNPSNLLNTGKHCYKCPALATCPAARKAQLNAIDASEIAFNSEIDNEHLSFNLDHLSRAMAMLKQSHDAYEELALHRVKAGQIVKNYAAKNELANRSWKENVDAVLMKVLTGLDLSKKQLISPKQAEDAGASKIIVASMTERKQKGVKLVRIDEDKKADKLFNQPPT